MSTPAPAPGDGLPELLERLDALDPGAIPAGTRRQAARVVADTVGAIMAGTLEPELAGLMASGASLGPAVDDRPASVLAPGLPRLAAGAAALVNGTAAVMLELDEGHRPTGHPAAHILPAALAVAEAEGRSGRELIDALILGYEVTARLFAAYRLRYPLHCHGNFGTVGAAVAVARLRGRPLLEPGLIAAGLPLLTVWPVCLEGATVRNVWSGVSAWGGVLANELAGAGFTGSRVAVPAAFGELVGELVAPDAITGALDPDELQIDSGYFKLHSCCASAHSAIDAVLALAPIDPGAVEAIEVATVTNNLKIAVAPGENALSRRFSMPFAVAAAAVHGHAGPSAFAPDPEVERLASRVSVRADPSLEAAWPEASPARVAVHLRSGTRTAAVENPRGHWRNPASASELEAKFARLVWVADPAALYARLLALDELGDIGELWEAVAERPVGARP